VLRRDSVPGAGRCAASWAMSVTYLRRPRHDGEAAFMYTTRRGQMTRRLRSSLRNSSSRAACLLLRSERVVRAALARRLVAVGTSPPHVAGFAPARAGLAWSSAGGELLHRQVRAAKYEEQLSETIIAITRAAAAAAPAPEPSTNTMRIEVPKLDPANTHGDWPTLKAQIQALTTQHNGALNDASGRPVPGPLTAMQEAFVFGTLMQAVKEAGLCYLVMNDNPGQLGTVGWKNLCDNLDNTLYTMLLNQFMSSTRASTGADLEQWLPDG
jgi:hypothetical protein